MDSIQLIGVSIPVWIVGPILYLGWVVIGWLAKKILFLWLGHLSRKTETDLDDVLIAAVDRPLSILIFVSGGLVIPHFFVSPKLPASISHLFGLGLKACVILLIILFMNRLLLGLMKSYSAKVEVLRISKGFTEVLVRLVVFAIGGLVLLDSFGVSITPILASLGVGSLAVALALQPTLENLISGFQIILDRPILPGQFVKLESGEEGYVEKVGWRSTWIRVLPNNTVIVPNKQLINSRVLNYYYPDKELAVLVNVGVHYSSDLGEVERVTIEVANEIMKKVPGGVPEFKSFIRYHTFNSSSIDFTVIMRAKEFVDNYLIKHEFVKALSTRYAREGIVIPFPIQAINTEQEKAVVRVQRYQPEVKANGQQP